MEKAFEGKIRFRNEQRSGSHMALGLLGKKVVWFDYHRVIWLEHTHTNRHTLTLTHTLKLTHSHIHTHTHTQTDTRSHTHTHPQTYTLTHTHTHSSLLPVHVSIRMKSKRIQGVQKRHPHQG